MNDYEPWQAVNLKTGDYYTVISEGIDVTNSRAGTHVVIYTAEGLVFVRHIDEFVNKFRRVK